MRSAEGSGRPIVSHWATAPSHPRPAPPPAPDIKTPTPRLKRCPSPLTVGNPIPENRVFSAPPLTARSLLRSAAVTWPYLPVFLRRESVGKGGVNGCFFAKPGCRAGGWGQSEPVQDPDWHSPKRRVTAGGVSGRPTPQNQRITICKDPDYLGVPFSCRSSSLRIFAISFLNPGIRSLIIPQTIS
jgi:hypothetical protein